MGNCVAIIGHINYVLYIFVIYNYTYQLGLNMIDDRLFRSSIALLNTSIHLSLSSDVSADYNMRKYNMLYTSIYLYYTCFI